jgi:hypothetical protein
MKVNVKTTLGNKVGITLGVDDVNSEGMSDDEGDGIAFRPVLGLVLGSLDGLALGDLLDVVEGLELTFVTGKTMGESDADIDGILVGPTVKLGDMDIFHDGKSD